MRRRRALAILFCLGVAAWPASASAAAPSTAARGLPTVLQDDAAFLHGDDASVGRAMFQARALGVDRIRLTASWGTITRRAQDGVRPAGFDARDPGAYEPGRWDALDRAVRLTAEHGMDALVDVGFWAPRWATAGDDEDDDRPRTAIRPEDFADFAHAVARRYSGGFVAEGDDDALPRVATFALWNEPNHPAFLLPQYKRTSAGHVPVSPHHYRAMVQAAHPAVKAAAPSARVLVGNTSAQGGRGGRSPVAPLAFLRALACVDRALKPITTGRCRDFDGPVPGDGWAHHPYSLGVDPGRPSPRSRPDDARLADLPRMAALLRRLTRMGRLSPGLRDIHLTELGFETADLPGRPGVSEATQARYLTWAEHLASRTPGVRSFAQFLLLDVAPSATPRSGSPRRPFGEFSTGLRRATGEPKLATRTFTAGLFAARTAGGVELWGRLRLGPRDRRVRVQRSLNGGESWRVLASLRVPGDGTFSMRTRHVPGARYRLTYRTRSGRFRGGLPVRPKSARSRAR